MALTLSYNFQPEWKLRRLILDYFTSAFQKLIASMDDFAFKIIQKLAFNPQMTMNVVLSPMSIYVSLALVLFGAAGNTQTELIKALSFPADAEYD